MRAFAVVFILCSVVLSILAGNAYAADTGDPNDFDASDIEAVMRKYQNKYHYVAVVNNFGSKYLTWPQLHCSAAPSYPIGFYGEITEDEAETLVDSIVNKFYETSQYSYSNISGYFLEQPPEGQESWQTVIITCPAPETSWQDRLAQVSRDIDKLVYYRVYTSTTAWLGKSGSGSSISCHWVPCDPSRDEIIETDTFQDAKAEAESNWGQSTSSFISGGISIGTSVSHSCDDYCDEWYDYIGDGKTWSASISSKNFKLQADLRKHTGSATCYVKAYKSNAEQPAGSPVVGVSIDNKYHSWQNASVGSEWISDYVFADTPPVAVDPGSTTCTGTDSDYNSYAAGWVYSDAIVVVEPNFDSETDPVLTCSSPTELVYKSKDKHIAYSAGVGCGYESGETVKGRIIVNDYVPNVGMQVEVKLNDTFSDKVASLKIKNTTITPNNPDKVYCFIPDQDEPNDVWYVPFSVSTLVNEDQISFATAAVYSDIPDPNDARVKTYRGEGDDITFQIKTNGYECCNRKETLDQANDIPQVSKHENNDIEIFFTDISQSYIWGSGYIGNPPFSSYSKSCDYLDMSIVEYVPDGGTNGEYIKLFGAQGNILVYSIDSDWLTEDTAASAVFVEELDADGNPLKQAVYDENGRLIKICNAADPDNFYRQFNYDDPANPNRITSYTDYAGQMSRTYTLVYDEATGRLAGTIGGTGSGCSGCALPGENHLYIYNDSGSVLIESDIEGTIIYEFEYDSKNRLIAKWLGPKTNLNLIREIVYDIDAGDFGGAEIQDIYDYTTDSDYRFTRNILDSYGQVVTEIAYDTLNIDSSSISPDPNVIIASGGRITTYEYEYSGNTLLSISAQSPAFNIGDIHTYYKNTLNNPSNSYEDTILVSVDPNGIDPDKETRISRNQYAYYMLNGVSVRRLAYSYDARGLEDGVYTAYSYSSNGPLSGRDEPGIYQLNGDYTELNYDYTYYGDSRSKTETISNNNQSATRLITTYFYNYLGDPTGTETRDYNGNLLYRTQSRSNGFGEQIYSIDKSGVARGKEYDAYGKLVSEFVFADATDTALFDGDDPNALLENISGVYSNLNVISQTRYVYNTLGQLEQVKVAVADDVFTYDTPDGWYITTYLYDDCGQKIQQTEDTIGLALITTYEYNNQGQLVKTNYPDGRWHKQIQNGRGLVIKTIDGHGSEATQPNDFIVNETIYDADGNIVKEIIDGDVVTSYELNDRGMIFRQYQGDYETEYCDYTEYARDLDGRVLSQIAVDVDDIGNETVISEILTRYNARGERIEQRIIADPTAGQDDLHDRVTLYNYDFQGQLTETISKADGNSQIYTNANKDRVKYESGDLIEQSWFDIVDNLDYTLKFEYVGDAATAYDLPFSNIDNAFRYTKGSRNVYIAHHNYTNGRLSDTKVLNGFNEDDPYFNNWSYPQAGLLWHSIQRYEYDTVGKTVKIFDADDNFKTFSYNSRNQRTEEMLWQGKPILRLSDGSYDPNTFDPYPLTKMLIDYDNAGRKVRQVKLSDPNSSVDVDHVDLSYDHVVDTIYDDYGRLYRQRTYFDGENGRISLKEYRYDGHSRIDIIEFCELEEVFWIDGSLFIETKFPQKSVSYHYDTKGQKDMQTITNVNTVTGQTVDINSYYDYDSQGRLRQIQNSQGVTYTCKYDAFGRKSEETDETGTLTWYFYDTLGNLTYKVEDPTGLDRQTEYGYDRLGRQTAIISGTDQTDYAYNYLGEITDVNYPSDDTISYGYDMLGSVVCRTVTKAGQSVTTHYKRNALGRVCYKQYSDQLEWSEPNNLLPFDEMLYDALGNKRMIAYIDGENDLELNLYSYDYFGNLTGAGETGGNFSSSVAYGYDQRGLLTSITYPNEKTVLYKRDAMGRIESVSYEGKTLVEYGYLGDTLISKTMPNADIEYMAAVDTLGRITGETFSDISTSTAFITNSYDYTSHSSRLDERNGIIYGFDTLGKLTSEDSTSYTSDILGNPTNASDDGLTYGLDNEDRIADVDDGGGIFAEYEYDRLGRQAKRSVSGADTHFVYDLFGNVIAEYEDGNWSHDYIYGAAGEVVYMRFPQTTEMNDALENFVGFIDAWLCYPGCTQDDLQWDSNADDQINLIDWAVAVDANDFAGAFMTNGRYLLTDFHNSVIGKVNLDGSVDEISYNAWGIPYVTQGADLEGLSIFWNGYYLDSESGNYYLRNRYYSPVERRFLTEDPHGINPDGNWNNPFGVRRQYSDGYGLRVYAQSDPVNNGDPWGLWKYALPAFQRTKEAKTFIEASGVWEMKYNIKGLAQLVRLNEEEFEKWGKRAIRKVNGIKKCGAWVPNTAYVNKGDVSAICGPKGGITFVNLWVTLELNDIERHFESLGYHVQRNNSMTYDAAISQFSSGNIIAWSFGGHGFEGALFTTDDLAISDSDAKRSLKYKLAEIVLLSCQARYNGSWENIKSKYGLLRASELSINAAFTDWEDLPTE